MLLNFSRTPGSKFSEVRALVYLLYNVKKEKTFGNLCLVTLRSARVEKQHAHLSRTASDRQDTSTQEPRRQQGSWVSIAAYRTEQPHVAHGTRTHTSYALDTRSLIYLHASSHPRSGTAARIWKTRLPVAVLWEVVREQRPQTYILLSQLRAARIAVGSALT